MSKVIVFGASATETWEPIYQEAILLGKKLAMYGHEVWNGGYFGLMGAVSRGAISEGGVVVGSKQLERRILHMLCKSGCLFDRNVIGHI